LSIALLIFFLSLIGIPPTGGFMGKFLVFGAAINQGFYALAAFGVFNSVISVYYYFGIIRLAFFTEGPDESPLQPDVMLKSIVGVSMVMTVLIALAGQPFILWANDSAQILAATF
jgi:NADH-quinone oxidoreductase subunit N